MNMKTIEEETVLIPFMRYHYTYSNGKVSIISMEMNANMMDPEGEPLWIALMSMYYQYNNQNHLTMMYMAATDMETGEMIIGSRVHFVYENNRVHSVVNFEIDEETEEAMYDKSVVEYDANGRAIQMIAYSSPDSSSWTQYEKTVMTYDPTDTSNYDTFQNIVDNSNYMQIGFNYNFGTARVNNEMTYSWNGSEWENLGKELYAYDTNWNITLNQEQEWINNDWQTFSEVQLAYVNAQQLDYQIHKELNNDILQEYIRYRYNYTTANDNQVIAPSTISINAYPNPFNGNTNITVKSNDKQVKVQLYNIKGRLIAEENMNLNRSNNVNFNTEHLSSGIYFVKVKSATESKTCKIMKIK